MFGEFLRNKKIFNHQRVDPYQHDFTGLKQVDDVSLQLFSYTENDYQEDKDFKHTDVKKISRDHFQYWLNIYGIHKSEVIKEICESLGVHNLVVQGILDVNQRYKYQDIENYRFFTFKVLSLNEQDSLEEKQISFIISDNYLVTFQEKQADLFRHIRERIRLNIGITRKRKVNFLLYLLIESILDSHAKVLNHIEQKVSQMDLLEVKNETTPRALKSLERYKRQVYQIKKAILPIYEFISLTEKEDFEFVEEKNIKFYFELKDFVNSLINDCEQLELMLESSSNLFFSMQSHHMNQVMKTLTVISAIFIPLTFIAGIYGMNFHNMPELKWEWGYYAVMIIMLLLSFIMLLYFKVKKWF